MNKIGFFLIGLLIIGCKKVTNTEESILLSDVNVEEYQDFGHKIKTERIIEKNDIASLYEKIGTGDTVEVAFKSTVHSVCKAKGCWMRLAIGNEQEVMVRFKDYSFFVPKNIENDSVIVQGKAFVKEMTVEDQRHFAIDAGKTQEEIAAIVIPKKTFSFIADGVLIKK